jgi:hypothetical protein
MKSILITLILLCGNSKYILAQYYEHTGKVSDLTLSATPLGSIHLKKETANINYFASSIEYAKMLRPGIFPTIGYAYQQAYNAQVNTPRTLPNIIPFQDAHEVNASVEFRKKRITKSQRIKSAGMCLFQRFGILLAPEYAYLYSTQIQNHSKGEFALKTGIYYYKGSNKVNVSSNILYSIYYRKGLTPIITTETSFGTQNYYRDEIGIRITILFRKMYRFGW